MLSVITDPIHTPVTLFWPSDQALQSLPPEQQGFLFNQDNKDKLKEYLKFHVIRDAKVFCVCVWLTDPCTRACLCPLLPQALFFSLTLKIPKRILRLLCHRSAFSLPHFTQQRACGQPSPFSPGWTLSLPIPQFLSKGPVPPAAASCCLLNGCTVTREAASCRTMAALAKILSIRVLSQDLVSLQE